MRKKLLDVLACPDCYGILECEPSDVADDSDVIAGSLICQTCKETYPIERGIPRFVPSGNYATSFGYQWNRFRREQIDSLNGTRQSEKRLLSETPVAPLHTIHHRLCFCSVGEALMISVRRSSVIR